MDHHSNDVRIQRAFSKCCRKISYDLVTLVIVTLISLFELSVMPQYKRGDQVNQELTLSSSNRVLRIGVRQKMTLGFGQELEKMCSQKR